MDVTTFPLSFSCHLIFSLIAGCFFLLQYLRQPYINSSIIIQLLTIAIPASLLIYLGRLMEHLGQTGVADFFNGKPWFHTIGALEAVLLLGALALSILAKVRRKKNGQDDADDQPKEDAA